MLGNKYGAGAGNDEIWLDDVECLGIEKDLADCEHKDWGSHNCNHNEDVSIFCVTGKNIQYFALVFCKKVKGILSDSRDSS